jgi:methyl-accepting chemotaxis protein
MTTSAEVKHDEPMDKRVKKDAYDEILRVLEVFKSGNLVERADMSGYSPKNQKILAAVNEILDLHASGRTVDPKPSDGNSVVSAQMIHLAIRNLTSVFSRMAEGNLSVSFTASQEAKAHPVVGDDFTVLEQACKGALCELGPMIQRVKAETAAAAGHSDMLKQATASLIASTAEINEQVSFATKSSDEASSRVSDLVMSISKISQGTGEVSEASGQVSSNLAGVGSSSEEISAHMNSIAESMDEMTRSMNMVASAVEEMSASLGEVSKSSAEAANLAVEAVSAAGSTTQTMDKLGKSAKAIGKVVEMIKGIASQTNHSRSMRRLKPHPPAMPVRALPWWQTK